MLYRPICLLQSLRWTSEPLHFSTENSAWTLIFLQSVFYHMPLLKYMNCLTCLTFLTFLTFLNCKNVLILLLLKVYEKYDYNSSICTSNDNKLAVTSFKIWLFHKLVPNLLHICYQISWTMQRVKCTFS